MTDQPRPYRGREAHPDVVEPGTARRSSETPLPLRARQPLGLHPLPDVVLGHGADRHVGESDRGKHLVGTGCGTRSPVLRRRPLTPPLRERDLAGGRIDPVAANDSGCRLVQPPLRVDLLQKVTGVLDAGLVALPGPVALRGDKLLPSGLLIDSNARRGALGDAGHASSCASPPHTPSRDVAHRSDGIDCRWSPSDTRLMTKSAPEDGVVAVLDESERRGRTRKWRNPFLVMGPSVIAVSRSASGIGRMGRQSGRSTPYVVPNRNCCPAMRPCRLPDRHASRSFRRQRAGAVRLARRMANASGRSLPCEGVEHVPVLYFAAEGWAVPFFLGDLDDLEVDQ